MAMAEGKLEWRINVSDGRTESLEPESGPVRRLWLRLKCVIFRELILKIWRFLEKAWSIAVAEPKKVIHGVKVGLALSIVSLLYYMRPLYEGVGGNAMWAVMTVVVVFESTVGATLCKCINRATGTFLAGSLGVGVNWVANQSGDQLEPVVLGAFVFFFASAATFSRFVPSVKARFDYGAMIFILTFSLVSVSGYRVEKLLALAHQRVSTIAIGASICIFISMLFCPIWAGEELHLLIQRNLGKLADSLDGCMAEYFRDNESSTVNGEDASKKMQGYKCVLNSKATEESMANFARWEPAHGRFNFRHPWKQYLKVGASMRSCAYCIETLNSCINSEIQAPEHLKKLMKRACMNLTSVSSSILKELAITLKTMRKPSKIDFFVSEMNFAVQELQDTLKSIPNHLNANSLTTTPETDSQETKVEAVIKIINVPPLMEILPLTTMASLLLENASRIQGVASMIDELATLAEFRPASNKKQKQNELCTNRPVQENRV